MKKNIQTAYGDPTPAFHHKVMNTLYHLDDTVPAKTKRFNAKKIAVFAIVAAVIGTTTVVAAATNMFGLIQEPVGKYGVSITAGMNASEEEDPQYNNDYDIVTAYLPEGYTIIGSHGGFTICPESGRYAGGFHLFGVTYEADTYHRTEAGVISTEEKTLNGHPTIINCHKESEESDKVYYTATVKFEEENIVVWLTSDRETEEINYDELIKILEGLSVVPAAEETPNTTPTEKTTTIDRYKEEFDKEPAATVSVGTAYETVIAGKDGVEKNISIKVSSVIEQDNAVGMDRNDFANAGPLVNLRDYYFDSSDQLIDSHTKTVYDSIDGINSLSHTHEETIQHHFYVASVEITAQQDIDDIYDIMSIYTYGIDENGTIFHETGDGRIMDLYLSGYVSEPQISVKAGETITLKAGFIADNDLKQNAVLEIKTINCSTEKTSSALVPLN